MRIKYLIKEKILDWLISRRRGESSKNLSKFGKSILKSIEKAMFSKNSDDWTVLPDEIYIKVGLDDWGNVSHSEVCKVEDILNGRYKNYHIEIQKIGYNKNTPFKSLDPSEEVHLTAVYVVLKDKRCELIKDTPKYNN